MTNIKHKTESTASWTPGPWHIHDKQQKSCRYDVWPARGLSAIATVCNWPNEGAAHLAEAKANARLIAAAPDLLEALEYAHAILGRIYDGEEVTEQEIGSTLHPSSAAIAKASGRAA